MQRLCAATVLACLAGLFLTPLALAQDPNAAVKVYRKSDPEKGITGNIGKESVKGIRLKGSADIIPAEDIADVDYEEQLPISLRLKTYRQAKKAEDEAAAADRDKRNDKLKVALQKYEEALAGAAANLYAARRHLEFKSAYLPALMSQGSANGADRLLAILKLKDFTQKNPDSWQYVTAMQLLASLQAEQNNIAEAQETLNKLVKADVSDDIKQNARLTLVRYTIQDKKFDQAQKELQQLITSLPKDSPQQLRARLMDAECLAAMNKVDDATKKLQGFLKDIQDKDLRAAAYNTLGECFYRADRLQDARWPFLWVDVIYNQDKEQHAKALYYLWDIFYRLSEFDRAQEFYETLVSNDRFAASEWRQKAMDRRKKLQ